MELRRRRLTPRTSSGTPKLWQLLADLHRTIYANHRYLRMPSGPRVRPAQSQLSATAPKRAQAVSGIVSKTARRLTGDRGFESVSLQRGVRCEPDFLCCEPLAFGIDQRLWILAGVPDRQHHRDRFRRDDERRRCRPRPDGRERAPAGPAHARRCAPSARRRRRNRRRRQPARSQVHRREETERPET
jgi:hypothetical protein